MRLVVALALLLAPEAAFACSHEWDIVEVFSNVDGSVQFIEMEETAGLANENFIGGLPFTSDLNTYLFPGDILGDTTFKKLLMATQALADLPGAPTPDYIIPEQFFDPSGDTLKWRFYDTLIIPAIPTDGVHSLNRDLSTGVNSPTNFAGASGSVVAANPVPVLPRAALLLSLLVLMATGALLRSRRCRAAS